MAMASEMGPGCMCPCCFDGTGEEIQDFIRDDYYCESGNNEIGADSATLYSDDPLWDGMGCESDESACCNSNQPWFCKSFGVARSK